MIASTMISAPRVAPAAPKRAQVVVAAHADRRVAIGGLIAGVAAFVGADKAQAGVTNVDLFDDRAAKKKGFEIIYEAREIDLPQSERDGITQFRGDLKATKARLAESTRRINESLDKLVAKSYWTPAKEELRLQLGNMRQDINTLASTKPTKAEKKEALAKAKAFITKTDELDFAMRKKDLAGATKAYASVKSSLADLNSYLS